VRNMVKVMPPAVAGSFSGSSFSRKNRLGRGLWNAVYASVFRTSPRPLHDWRAFLLRWFGAKLGRGCHVYSRAVIWAPWNLECGERCGIADGAILYNQAPIQLGRWVTVSQGSHLCTGSHNYESDEFELIALPITMGDYAWVCADCFVGPGVNIGEGAVVGARSVVIRDVPAWTVCAGHPCQVIKPRNWRPA
jgi:putative colanic acid biosynthesis acetyltransferase WcaF